MLYTDRGYHLPDDLMVKNDRMTMAFGLEARVPFCDRALVAYLATVPTEHLMRGLKPKALLREAMHGLLPTAITHRKKMGLEMPYSKWMRGPLAAMTEDILSPARVAATGLLHPSAVQKLLREHREMTFDHGRPLWSLLNFVLWHELFIQSDGFRSTTVATALH
jgi:asparagine synthase (glutamine-hydrolysing)